MSTMVSLERGEDVECTPQHAERPDAYYERDQQEEVATQRLAGDKEDTENGDAFYEQRQKA